MTFSPKNSLRPACTSTQLCLVYRGPESGQLAGIEPPQELLVLTKKGSSKDLEACVTRILKNLNGPQLISSALYQLALQRDNNACEAVLQHATKTQSMLEFWVGLVHHAPEEIIWMGRHEGIARHIFLPMPCPDRQWTIEHNADKENPVPQFRQWWLRSFPGVWRRAVLDHLSVEWKRRFIGQPKLYWLLDEPTIEQALFAATRPQPALDFGLLQTVLPDPQLTYKTLQEIYSHPKDLRQQWTDLLKQKHPPQIFEIPPL